MLEACRYVDEVLLQAAPVCAKWLLDNNIALNVIAFKNEDDRKRHHDTSVGYDRSREVELPYEHGISTSDIIARIEGRAKAGE